MVANAGTLKLRFKEPLAKTNAEVKSVSAFTAKALLDMSYRDVASLADGYAAQRLAQGA